MLPAQKAHVVTCDNRRYVLQKDPGTITNSKPACYHVYSFSFSTEEKKGVFLEYWKVIDFYILILNSLPYFIWKIYFGLIYSVCSEAVAFV